MWKKHQTSQEVDFVRVTRAGLQSLVATLWWISSAHMLFLPDSSSAWFRRWDWASEMGHRIEQPNIWLYIHIYLYIWYIYTLYIHRLYRAQLELGTLYTFHWDTLDAMWEDMTHVSCRPEVLRLDKIDCIDPVCIETERAFAKRLIPICALLVIRFWDWDLWNGRLVFVNTIPGMDYTQPLPPLVQYTGPVVDVKKMEPFSEDVATHGNRRSFFFTTINHNKSKCESIFLWL